MKIIVSTIISLTIGLFTTVSYSQNQTEVQQPNRVTMSLKPSSSKSQPDSQNVSSGVSSVNNESVAAPQVEIVNEPIEAQGYTDENYFINKQKSIEQQARMEAIPTPASPVQSKEIRLQNYLQMRDTYPVGSYEYETIQGKINKLNEE